MFTKSGFSKSKFILLLGMLLTWSGAFSQLDSVSVDLTFEQDTILDSLGGSDTLDYMNVNVYTDDVDFLGEIVVSVYDGNSDFPLGKLKFTKQEALDQGILSGSTTTIRFDYRSASESFKVETLVRNYQGGNLPLVTVYHN